LLSFSVGRGWIEFRYFALVDPQRLFLRISFVSFLLIMTFDLKAQPVSISSAICGLRRVIIVFSSLFETNKMEKIKWKAFCQMMNATSN